MGLYLNFLLGEVWFPINIETVFKGWLIENFDTSYPRQLLRWRSRLMMVIFSKRQTYIFTKSDIHQLLFTLHFVNFKVKVILNIGIQKSS